MLGLSLIEWIIVIIGIIVVYFIIFLILYAKVQTCNDYPIIKTNNLNSFNFQNGDIISVGYLHPFGGFISVFSDSVVSHPGIIYKKSDNEIYVLEAASYTKKYHDVMLIPLQEWLKFNKRHPIFYSKYVGPKISNEQIVQTYEKFKDVKLDSFNLDWIRLLKVTPYQEVENRKYVCYEITILMLQQLNIVQKKYSGNSYWPKNITYGTLDYNENIKYLYPVQILNKFYITQQE